jgi:fatty-acyl-CoA synthase/long-chain acyl-CoA synthetase
MTADLRRDGGAMSGFEIKRELLGDALDRAAAAWGDRVGWTFEDSHVSFADMRRRADETAQSLLRFGVGPGDVVAVWMPNLPEFAYTLFACAKIGAIVTAINTRAKLFELEHVLGHSEAKLLVLSDRFLNLDFAGMAAELLGPGAIGSEGSRSEGDGSEGAVNAAQFPKLRRLIGTSSARDPRLMPWSRFVAAGQEPRWAEALAAARTGLRPEQPVLLQYTSGTTALPKGALCNHVYVLNFGAQNMIRMGVKPGEAVLNTQPFYHVGGSCGAVPTPLSWGCHFAIPEYYEVERVLRLIERERCVSRTGFAAMYIMEMEHPRFGDFDLSSLRSGWCVGSPELMERVRDRMGLSQLVQLYGSTEACGTSGAVGEPWEKRSRTCGRVYDGMEIAIFDMETGARLPPGTSGEIALRGWCTMNGYLKQPEETAKTIDADGWVHSGDYGMLDEEGYLYFQGRIKNMIRVGGENVAAEEVEAMLMRHPEIKMAAAIPMPDARLDEVVLAIVELAEGSHATEDDIIAFCKPRMANFRVPRAVRFVREWPLTGSGKIHKHALVQQFGAGPAAPA